MRTIKVIAFIIAIVTLAFSPAYAQDVKFKRGDILINKTNKIGTFKKQYVDAEDGMRRYQRYYKDMNGNEVYTYTKKIEGGQEGDFVYVMKANFTGAQIEISPFFIKTIPSEKGMVRYMLEKGYWDLNGGINKSVLLADMEGNTQDLTDAKTRTDAVKQLNPFVKRSGKIVAGGPDGTRVIGYVESPDSYLQTGFDPIKVYDVNKNLIAKGKSGIFIHEVFTTFDNVEHKYKITTELNELLKPVFLTKAVFLLMQAGYIIESGKHQFDASKNIFLKK